MSSRKSPRPRWAFRRLSWPPTSPVSAIAWAVMRRKGSRGSRNLPMNTVCSEALEEKVLSARRLTREEGLWLWQCGDLLELAQLANHVRDRLNPEPVVTFVIDSNPNYTNVCITDCV